MLDFEHLSAIIGRMRAEMKAPFKKMKSGQDWMLARADVFEEKLDKMNSAWKACIGKTQANIETG
jgi:hypothetical protein